MQSPKYSLMKLLTLSTLMFFSFTCLAQNNEIGNLIEVLDKHLKTKRIPGAMISIVTKDSILFQGGIGYANLEEKELVTVDHLFRLGSISKSFTSLGAIHILGNSAYNLNTPIRDIDGNIPFTNPWEESSPVRFKHLLEHTAGFEDFSPNAMYNRVDVAEPSAFEMIASHKNSLHSRWKPGKMKAYCNPGYIVAGHLIEVISGASYSEYIEKNILDPLEMYSTGYYFKKPQSLSMAQGYTLYDGVHRSVSFRSIQGGPAGGLCSNAREMAKYLQFMLTRDGGRVDSTIFKEEIFERIENAESTLAAQAGLSGGYGLGNFSIWKNGHLFYGHDGGIDGFMSRYVYSREANLGVAVSINRMGNATEIADLIIAHLLEPQSKVERKISPIPEELKSKYEGFYGFKNFKRKLFSFSDKMLAGLILDFEGDTLHAKSILGKHKYTLHHAGNNMFYLGEEEKPSVMLLENEEGTPVLWINDSYTEMESRSMRLISSITVIISLLVPFIFMIFSFIKIIIRGFKQKRLVIKSQMIWLASISYLMMFVGLAGSFSDPYEAGVLNGYTFIVYISSSALLVFTLLSVITTVKKVMKTKSLWYHLLLPISFMIIVIFFGLHGFIGLKLWVY